MYIKGWALERSPFTGKTNPKAGCYTLSHTAEKMPADYNGRWEMVKNENFEDVMKALGKFHPEMRHSRFTKKEKL